VQDAGGVLILTCCLPPEAFSNKFHTFAARMRLD